MAMKPQKLFYRSIQLPSGQWHWQIEYKNGEAVFTSIQGYTRQFDAVLGFKRIWGRSVIHLPPAAKPPAASKTARATVGKNFAEKYAETVAAMAKAPRRKAKATTKPKTKKRKSMRKVKRSR